MGGVIKSVLGGRLSPNNNVGHGRINVEAELSKLMTVVDNLTADNIPPTEARNFVSQEEKATYAAASQGIAAKGQATLTEGSVTVAIAGIGTTNLVQVTFFSINDGSVADTKFYLPTCSAGYMNITAIKSDGTTTNVDDTSILNYLITTP